MAETAGRPESHRLVRRRRTASEDGRARSRALVDGLARPRV